MESISKTSHQKVSPQSRSKMQKQNILFKFEESIRMKLPFQTSALAVFPPFIPICIMSVSLALFSVKTSEARGFVVACTACFTQALNSNDLLSEWQTQQMLTLSNAKCLSSPLAFALLWPLDEVSSLATWLWVTACVSEQAWMCMCMLQIDLPLVCHIKLALCWPPSCLQAVPYIPQLSLATLRT